MRTTLDLLLLTAAAILVGVGIAHYPNISAATLAALVVVAALLLAPIGNRTSSEVNA